MLKNVILYSPNVNTSTGLRRDVKLGVIKP